jgi:hypothetical protein
MPEELQNTKHSSLEHDPCPPSKNYKTLPDHEHDLTKCEYKEILEFIDEKMCKRGLKEEGKLFLKMRWLKAVLHLEYEAKRNDRLYFRSSVIVLIASAITTALTGANLTGATNFLPINLNVVTFMGKYLLLSIGNDNVPIAAILRTLIFILSLTVTIIIGLMNLYKFDEIRWKKRIYAEKLKAEGFQFLQLIGPYSKYEPSSEPYNEKYPDFAKNVERLIKEVNEGYTNLFSPSKKNQDEPNNPKKQPETDQEKHNA